MMSNGEKPQGKLSDSDAVESSDGKKRAKMALLQKSGDDSEGDS